jgi:hypothetical protein
MVVGCAPTFAGGLADDSPAKILKEADKALKKAKTICVEPGETLTLLTNSSDGSTSFECIRPHDPGPFKIQHKPSLAKPNEALRKAKELCDKQGKNLGLSKDQDGSDAFECLLPPKVHPWISNSSKETAVDNAKPLPPKATPAAGAKKMIRFIFPRDWTAKQIADHIKKVITENRKN